MQSLFKFVEQLRKQTLTEQLLVNRIREYLQVLVLKSVYHSKFASSLSFMGGTALRICYDLKRFSEDMDFALDRPARDYSFSGLMDTVRKDMDSQGYLIEVTREDERIVQKAFVKLSKILYPLGLTHRESQKIHIKVEVDTNPIKIRDDQMESFFVAKFNEIFPVLKHKLETSFAGKISAILGRKYTKGRDYYDLIWYLARKTDVDMDYLNSNVKQQLGLPAFNSRADVFQHLDNVVTKVHPETILKDIGRFLEDPREEEWLKNYQAIFRQLVAA